MTAIDSGLRPHARPHFTFWTGFKRMLVRIRRHRRVLRAHMELSRLDERLLYDIGLEPLDLAAVLRARQPPSMLLEAMRRELDHNQRPPAMMCSGKAVVVEQHPEGDGVGQRVGDGGPEHRAGAPGDPAP